jgi:hypothetical protein
MLLPIQPHGLWTGELLCAVPKLQLLRRPLLPGMLHCASAMLLLRLLRCIKRVIPITALSQLLAAGQDPLALTLHGR